jgi:tetrahydromethanopterin S-methyltransferase subunit F
MASTPTDEAIVELSKAVMGLGEAVQHDAATTVESVRLITVGEIADRFIGVACGVLSGAVWVVQSLAYKKMEAPASAQASG